MFAVDRKQTDGPAASWAPKASGPVAALVVSAHARDRQRLREIFSGMDWKLREARSCREASAALCSYWTPVIVCDRSLPDGQWKDILSLIAPMLDPPRVIVMSGSSDDLWAAEVLNMGGYGVVSKPLDETEVIHLVAAACRTLPATEAASPRVMSAA